MLPWTTTCDNVGFALRADGASRAARRERARTALAEVVLAPEAIDKFPRQLSGGMRQRVALARALAVRPDLLLCDQPFSALDARSRRDLRQLLCDIQARAGPTTVFVTHDSEEALSLADVLVVMAMGRIEQVGTPAEILSHPASAMVRAQISG